MKKLLLLLFLLPALAFGQATGYVLSNFATSGSIGTAASTVDVYSRININQTTASITLTVPVPTNKTTKVTEVWIGNKGTVPFTLVPGDVVDTGKFIIVKWIGGKYSVVGGGTAVDLSGKISLDGSSLATTDFIKIGADKGFEYFDSLGVTVKTAGGNSYLSSDITKDVGDGTVWSSFNYLSNEFAVSSVNRETDVDHGNALIRVESTGILMGANPSRPVGDDGYAVNITTNNLTGIRNVLFQDINYTGIADLTDVTALSNSSIKLDGTSPPTTGLIKIGDGLGFIYGTNAAIFGSSGSVVEADRLAALYVQNNAGTITSSVQVKTDNIVTQTGGNFVRLDTGGLYINTGAGSLKVVAPSSNYTATFPDKTGTVAYTSDLPTGLTASSPLSYNSGTGVLSIPNSNGSTDGYLSSTNYTNFSTAYANRITSLTTTGTSGSATLSSNVLNVPAYTLAGLGGIGLTGLSATAPLSYNNTTGAFTISQSTTSTNGYLSSTDWNTFNNKQATLVSGTNIKTLYGATLLGSGDAGITPPAYGGTGVNNGTFTSTLSGNFTTTGAFNATFAIPRSTTWTFPNTASETLAGLGTAQTFTALNKFANTEHNQVFIYNCGTSTPLLALQSDLSNRLNIGSGFSSILITPAVSFNNGLASDAIRTRTLSVALAISSTSTTSANSGDISIIPGSISSGSSFTTGSIMLDVGTNAGLRGGVSLFNGASAPTWNGLQRGMYWGNATAEATTNPSSGAYLWVFGDKFKSSQSIHFPFIGQGIGVKTGANGRLFTATLAAGTITVSNTSVTTSTKAIVTLNTGGAAGTLGQYTYTCTAGQIVITSLTAAGATQTLDTSTVQVYLIEGL